MSSLGWKASTRAERMSFALGRVGMREAVSIGMLFGSARLSDAIIFLNSAGRPDGIR
jgi:hypothetical protein